MPDSEEILQLLEKISNEQILFAIIFHLLIFGLIVAVLSGWKPSNLVLCFLLTLPMLSVSVIAWLYGNPFNGLIFLVAFILLMIFSFMSSDEKVKLTSRWLFLSAIVMIAFGWFYPHFLHRDFSVYIFAAPTGLIPCPTLSVVIGFALLFKGLHSKKWALTLAMIGLFYGIFGVLKLKVVIDSFLIAGSVILIYQALWVKKSKILTV